MVDQGILSAGIAFEGGKRFAEDVLREGRELVEPDVVGVRV